MAHYKLKLNLEVFIVKIPNLILTLFYLKKLRKKTYKKVKIY